MNKFKPRSPKKKTEKDLFISNAKLTYVQTNRGYDAKESLLETFRGLCPKAPWISNQHYYCYFILILLLFLLATYFLF